jgi:ribosomal protein S17
VDFSELNDKVIKGLMDLSKIVSKFYLYVHEQLMKYLFKDEYYMAHIDKNKYMIDLNA